MRKNALVWTVVIIIGGGLLWALLFMDMPNSPPSYWSFSRHRSQKYYSRFADACDELLSRVKFGTTNEIRLAGNDPLLPPVLQKMHSTFIDVGTNRVNLVVYTAAGYGVVWETNEFSPPAWQLIVRSEAEPVIVYERKISAQVQKN
jgi:hypothetical protein